MIPILVVLCLVGFLLWLIPMDSRIKTIIIVVAGIIVAIMLYNMFAGGGSLRLPSFK